MIDSLFKVLIPALTLWKNKDARKYLDKVIQLKKEWYSEYNKDISDDAVLDNIEFELRIISESFSSQVGTENAKAK